MRPRVSEIEAKGARLALVGSGSPEAARRFAATVGLPSSVAILCDPELRSYRILGLRRSIAATLGLRPALRWLQAWRKGFRQGRIQGDAFQQGGALVVDASGEIRYRFANRHAGDHPPLEAVLAALA